MCSRPKYANLITMGGTRLCGPMRIIFGNVIKRWYTFLYEGGIKILGKKSNPDRSVYFTVR